MKRWLKIALIAIVSVVGLVAALAGYIYFQVDTRVELKDDEALFDNSKDVVRLDSTIISSDSITNRINKLIRSASVAGLGISIINNGDVVYQQYFGQTIEPGAILYGASFSKTMLADVALQLTEDGSLSLDSPLYKYLHKPIPEYRTTTVAQFFGPTITTTRISPGTIDTKR